MLPKFSNLFSKKEQTAPAPAKDTPPTVPAPVTPPPLPQHPLRPPAPLPQNLATTRPLPNPSVGRTPLRAPLAPPAMPHGIKPAEQFKAKKRITQRITVNVPPSTVALGTAEPGKLVIPGVSSSSEYQPQSESASGNINIPLHIVLRALPPQILAPEAQTFIERTDSGATVPIPAAMILSMLPSGKLEFTIKEFLPQLPGSVIKPMEEFSPELLSTFALPLGEVYPHIPPELIAKRKDQKPVDPRVLAMADPFSEEELRRKAEEARKAAEEEAAKKAFTESQAVPPPVENTIPPVEGNDQLPEPVAEIPQEVPAQPDFPKSEEIAVSPVSESAPVQEAALSSDADLLKLLAKANEEVDQVPVQAPAVPDVDADVTIPIPPVAVEAIAEPEAPQEEKTAEVLPASDFAAAIRELAHAEEQDKEAKPDIDKAILPPPFPVAKREPVAETSVSSESSPEEEKVAPLDELPVEEISKPAPQTVLAPQVAQPLQKSVPSPSALDINQCTLEDLQNVGCPEPIARKIIAWRELHGGVSDISRLRRIPGVTDDLYRSIVGLPEANSVISRELSELLGLPSQEGLTVKDVATQIRRWPYMSACIIGGMEGLPIASDGEDSKYVDSISAFVPRLFQQTNAILEEVDEEATHEIHLVKDNRSLSIYRFQQLFLVTVNLKRNLSGRDAELILETLSLLARLRESKLKT